MTDGDRDNAGVVAPPLIYLCPLVLGLLLNRRFPVRFLTRGAARPRVAAAGRWGIAHELVLFH